MKGMAEAINDDEQIPKKGLVITYYLPENQHYELQKEVYKLYNPSLDGLENKDIFDVNLLDVHFRFYKEEKFK